jgi:hypothetical protein
MEQRTKSSEDWVMIISELLRKWFGLPEPSCNTCEALRHQLANSERERRELLARLLEKDQPEPPQTVKEDLEPLKTTNFVPWRVRQQIMEAEDRKAAALMKDKAKEIAELEKELGIGSTEAVQ